MELVAADIGGSHARFALANVEGGQVMSLSEATTLKTVEHASLQTAWETFSEQLGRALPRSAAIAVACPIAGEMLKLTNNPWIIRPAMIAERLGVDRVTLINDFGAVGHAVVRVGQEHLRHLCGPEVPLSEQGVISIVGPGSGLGVAHVLCRDARYHVIECEGGHIDYAPVDSIEDVILARLRERYRRVSVERVVSGPGLANIYEVACNASRVVPSTPGTIWRCGRQPSPAQTAWRSPHSIASASFSVALPETSRWPTALTLSS